MLLTCHNSLLVSVATVTAAGVLPYVFLLLLQRSVRSPRFVLGSPPPHLAGGRAADDAALHARDAIKARARWLASGQRPGLVAPPSLKSWPFHCYEAKKVCFVENQLVALDPESPPAAKASYWRVPNPAALKWFAQAPVQFNLPGYFDGLKDVQTVVNPISVRPAALSLESTRVWEAPVLNVTPVIVFPVWPFNLHDVMRVFVQYWVVWAAKQPGMLSMPLAVALPHSLQLPPFWKLLESLGPGVETFSSLSKAYGTVPLCFEKVFGCTLPDRDWRTYASTEGSAAWEAFRTASVKKFCPLGAGVKDSGRLVVGLVQRQQGRQLLNMQVLLRQCKDLELTAAGKKIVCKPIKFTNILTDICPLQALDVIVGIHGAQLVNALFMRPGSSLIEIRPNGWWAKEANGLLSNPDAWPNGIGRQFWLTNNTLYWWYGALAKDSFPEKRSWVPARDSDVKVSWPILSCMLQKISAFDGRKEYASSRVPLTHNAGCKDPEATKR